MRDQFAKCSVETCRRIIETDEGGILAAVEIDIRGSEEYAAHVKFFGNNLPQIYPVGIYEFSQIYPELSSARSPWRICYSCFLKSLGVKVSRG